MDKFPTYIRSGRELTAAQLVVVVEKIRRAFARTKFKPPLFDRSKFKIIKTG